VDVDANASETAVPLSEGNSVNTPDAAGPQTNLTTDCPILDLEEDDLKAEMMTDLMDEMTDDLMDDLEATSEVDSEVDLMATTTGWLDQSDGDSMTSAMATTTLVEDDSEDTLIHCSEESMLEDSINLPHGMMMAINKRIRAS
jgi:hypothetical protein